MVYARALLIWNDANAHFVPYVGADYDVNLGKYDLNAWRFYAGWGSAANPGFSFDSNTSSGMFLYDPSDSVPRLGFSIEGNVPFYADKYGILATDGLASAPSLSFYNDKVDFSASETQFETDINVSGIDSNLFVLGAHKIFSDFASTQDLNVMNDLNVLNDLHLSGSLTDGSNSLTVANAKAAYDHISSTGADHSYIDQDVTTSASPFFDTVYASQFEAFYYFLINTLKVESGKITDSTGAIDFGDEDSNRQCLNRNNTEPGSGQQRP